MPGAQAEDFFTLNVDMLDMDSLNQNDYVAANLSAACQGIRVLKTISTSSELAEPVRLSLTRMDTQTLLFDKDYGYQSRNFDSDVIYLPYGGGSTVPYLVTLYVGDTVYAMPFMQDCSPGSSSTAPAPTACGFGIWALAGTGSWAPC